MAEHINNLLRLEVDASDIVNLITNHSGAGNSTAGWSAVSGTLTTNANPEFVIVPSPVTPYVARAQSTTASPVTAGQWVGLSGHVVIETTVDVNAFLFLRFEDSSGNLVAESTSAVLRGNLNTDAYARRQVPTGATQVRAVFSMRADTQTGASVRFSRLMMVKASSEAEVSNVPLGGGTAVWQNMLGNTYSIKTARGMDVDGVTDKPVVGSLSAVLSDPQFDPVSNPRMRPGRQIRLSTVDPSGGSFPIWQGRIATLDNSYDGIEVRTSITATDAWAELANIPVARGFNGTFKQRITNIMNQSAVGYYVYDPAANTFSTVIDSQDNASAQDQLMWARNSMQGFVWLTNDNRINAYAAGTMPTSPAYTLSDNPADTAAVKYTDIDTNFGSQALVNQLMVQRHNLNETADNGNKTYGPYSNDASIAQWGTRSATIEVNDGVPATLAANALAVYANPSIFVSGLKFNARSAPDATNNMRTYQVVRVKHSRANLDTTYRVISVEHDITPDSWEVSLGFRPMETPSTITVTNPPAGANTGPGDVTGPTPGILGRRFRNTDQGATTANSSLTVDFNQVATANGITWDGTNKRFIVPRTGRYYVDAAVRINGPVCYRHLSIYVNGINFVRTITYADNINTEQVSSALTLNAGDVVSIVALTTSACAIQGDGAGDTHCSIHFVGE